MAPVVLLKMFLYFCLYINIKKKLSVALIRRHQADFANSNM